MLADRLRIIDAAQLIYKDGIEYIEFVDGVTNGVGSKSKESDHLYMTAGTGSTTTSTQTYVTDVTIDFSNYSKLFYEWSLIVGVQESTANHGTIIVSTVKDQIHTTYDTGRYADTDQVRGVGFIDIAAFSDNYYIRVAARAVVSASANSTVKLYGLWLQR